MKKYKGKKGSNKSRNRSKSRSKSRSSLSLIPKIVLFFALLIGWCYANYLLIKGIILPKMITPVATFISTKLINQEKKSFRRDQINYFLIATSILSALPIIMTEFGHKIKDKYTTAGFITFLWSAWMEEHHGEFQPDLTDQKIAQLMIEFIGLLASTGVILKAETYAAKKILL